MVCCFLFSRDQDLFQVLSWPERSPESHDALHHRKEPRSPGIYPYIYELIYWLPNNKVIVLVGLTAANRCQLIYLFFLVET